MVVQGVSGAVALAAGGNTTCALVQGASVDTSTLKCWGNGEQGQVGNNTAIMVNKTPVTVSESGITWTRQRQCSIYDVSVVP